MLSGLACLFWLGDGRRCRIRFMALPNLRISGQIISYTYPRQPIDHPSVIRGGYGLGTIETANRHINLASAAISQERQLRATIRAERTQASCPGDLPRLSGGAPKVTAPERGPSHERRASAAATIRAVAMRHIVR